MFTTLTTGTYSRAPAAAFATVSVRPAARRSGMITPCTPAASAVLRMAPRFLGSSTPSRMRKSGVWPRSCRYLQNIVKGGVVMSGGKRDNALMHALRRLPVQGIAARHPDLDTGAFCQPHDLVNVLVVLPMLRYQQPLDGPARSERFDNRIDSEYLISLHRMLRCSDADRDIKDSTIRGGMHLFRLPDRAVGPVEQFDAAFIQAFPYSVRFGPVLARARFVPRWISSSIRSTGNVTLLSASLPSLNHSSGSRRKMPSVLLTSSNEAERRRQERNRPHPRSFCPHRPGTCSHPARDRRSGRWRRPY